MANAVPIDIRGFKGINIREPEGMIQDDELVSCINYNIGRAGELTKRTGFALLHDGTTLPNAPVSLLGQYQTDTYSQIIAKAGNKLYRSNDGISWNELVLSQAAGTPRLVLDAAGEHVKIEEFESPFTTSIQIDIEVKLADWTPTDAVSFVSLWNETEDERAFDFGINSTGNLTLSLSKLGTSADVATATSSVVAGVTDGEKARLRVFWSASDGEAEFYKWSGVEWDLLGTAQALAKDFIVPVPSGVLTVGKLHDAASTKQLTGEFYSVVIYTTASVNDEVAETQFDEANQWPFVTEYEDVYLNTWELAGGASIDFENPDAEDVPENATMIGDTAEWGVQYADKFYILRSDKVMLVWDGVTLKRVEGSPESTFGIIYRDRLFTCNWRSTVQKSRVFYSAPGNLASWPTTNFLDVNPGDGDFVTCLSIIHDLLIIFKTSTTWGLYVQGAPNQWTLRNTNPEIGCISKFTPREIEGFLYFVGIRGVYRTDGNIFEDISANIEPEFEDRVVALSTIDIDTAAWWDDRYIIRFNPTASEFKYWVHHLRTGGWTEWAFNENVAPSTFLEVVSSSPQRGLYAGTSANVGRVFRHGDGALNDAGQNFTCSFKTKDFDFALPSLMKRGKWMMIDVDAGGTTRWKQYAEGEEITNETAASTDRRRATKLPTVGYFRT